MQLSNLKHSLADGSKSEEWKTKIEIPVFIRNLLESHVLTVVRSDGKFVG